jgi:hypothetical protein
MVSFDSPNVVIGSKVGSARPEHRPKDIRKWTQEQRASLNKGTIIEIVASNGEVLTKMRENVFMAMTKKPGLLKNGKVQLPEEVLKPAVQFFVKHANALTGKDIKDFDDVTKDLEMCYATEALGMAMYTSHIYQLYDTPLQWHTLPYGQMIGIIKLNNPIGRRMFRGATYGLATLAWNGDIVDLNSFKQECERNPRLASSIKTLHGIWQDAAQRAAKNEEYKLKQAEYLRKKAAYEARVAAAEEKRKAEEKTRAAKDKKWWEGQKQQDADLRARMLEKKRTGAKMTVAEANMHYKLFGKRVPA